MKKISAIVLALLLSVCVPAAAQTEAKNCNDILKAPNRFEDARSAFFVVQGSLQCAERAAISKEVALEVLQYIDEELGFVRHDDAAALWRLRSKTLRTKEQFAKAQQEFVKKGKAAAKSASELLMRRTEGRKTSNWPMM